MATQTRYLKFTVHLTDPAVFNALLANPIWLSPANAATTFGATILVGNAPFVAPCITSDWFGGTANFPLDEGSFERCGAGWFGLCFGPFGTRTRYDWVGYFVLAPTLTGDGSPVPNEPPVKMATRRWIDGAELGTQGEGGSQTIPPSRAASRHLNGFGYQFDGQTGVRRHTHVESGGGPFIQAWERFYLRFHRFDAAEQVVWKGVWAGAPSQGWSWIKVHPSGALVLYLADNVSTVLCGTSAALPLHVWHKIDVIYDISLSFFPLIRIFLNGRPGPSSASVSHNGIRNSTSITSSEIGLDQVSTLVFDLDDWFGADKPTPCIHNHADVYPGYDWQYGSRMVRLSAKPPVVRLEGTLVAGNASITVPTTGSLRVGMSVYGVSSDVGPAPAESAAYVAAVKADLIAKGVSLTGACGAFEITSRVAWGLRTSGCGLLSKTSGNNCKGYASDIVLFVDGRAFDVLSDGGNTNGPIWNPTTVTDASTRYRPPQTPPGGGGTAVTVASIDSPTTLTVSVAPTEAGERLLTFLGASGFAADHNAAWVGNWRQAQPTNVRTNSMQSPLTSSTPAARLSLVTDAGVEVDALPSTVGVAALRVALYGQRAGVANGTIGYKLPDASGATGALTQATSPSWGGLLYAPVGLIDPIRPLAGLEIHHVKDSGATLAEVQALLAVAEVIGVFGPEDVQPAGLAPVLDPPAPMVGIHNAPYPRTPWARRGPKPTSPVVIQSGLYTGNGTVQDLTFRAPVHWLWIRQVSGTGHLQWLASANAGRAAGDALHAVDAPVCVQINDAFVPGALEDDQEQQTILSVVGNQANSNLSGSVYHYVAISDPGQRFFTGGALYNRQGAAALTRPLENPAFTPDAVFVQHEDHTTASNGIYYKGPGHAAAAISPLQGAEIASGLSMGLGQLTYLSGLSLSSSPSTPFLAARKNDGSGDAGIPRVVQIGSYTGDGSAARTVGLSPTGRRPLWVLVVPHNGGAILRDAAHTGTTSQLMVAGASNASTGITAGAIDAFQVGSALNSNAIIYDYFVLLGGVDACNNGFSCDGEFVPVEPALPIDPLPWDPDPVPTEPPPEPGGPGIPPILGEDFETECKPWSTPIINSALSKIGISKAIGDIATELSTEADAARLHYSHTVTQVLRDFPWPFATRYATLALVGGTPTTPLNPDWRYSYRRPADCVFERRLVVARTGAVDPTPPPFQLSSDTSGGLLLTNQPAAVLEYTYRPGCSAALGDPLWREAMIWKLAGAMAPSLSRMTTIVESCETHYTEALLKATLIIRPGNPGEEPVAGQIDLAATSQRANVDVINRALVRIGARTIRNLSTDQSQAANAVRAIFEAELRSTLRDHPWAFATTYVTPVLVGGTTATPVNGDWQYSYRLPDDVVFVRRIVTVNGKRTFELNPPPFRVGRDGTGALLFTDQVAVVLEVTVRRDAAVAQADDLFREAFAWRLAASLAPSLSLVDPARPEQEGRGPDYQQKEPPRVGQQQRAVTARWAWEMYQQALRRAVLLDIREQHQPLDDHLPDWITGRD